MLKRLALAIVATALLATPAFAQDSGRPNLEAMTTDRPYAAPAQPAVSSGLRTTLVTMCANVPDAFEAAMCEVDASQALVHINRIDRLVNELPSLAIEFGNFSPEVLDTEREIHTLLNDIRELIERATGGE